MHSEKRISVHHVGGRNGHGCLDIPPAFARDFVNVYYEADEGAVEQIAARQLQKGSQSHVLPYCLADVNGPGVININYDPFTSSLRPAAKRDDQHAIAFGFDYVYSEAFRTVEERSVALRRLDDIAELQNGDIPVPDILSLDTQGTEFEILEGAEKIVGGEALVVICEVEFIELYQGQRLFGDICRLLDRLGYDFIGFEYLQEGQSYRQPVGMRGKGGTASGEAIFFKRFTVVEGNGAALNKMALIAHILKRHALGFECMTRYEKAKGSASGGDTVYSRFLDELRQSVVEMPKVLPWTFKDLWSYENNVKRFDDSKRVECRHDHEMKRLQYGQYLMENHDTVVTLLHALATPVETTFRRFGMAKHADEIRSLRMQNAQDCCRIANLSYSYGDGRLRAWREMVVDPLAPGISEDTVPLFSMM